MVERERRTRNPFREARAVVCRTHALVRVLVTREDEVYSVAAEQRGELLPEVGGGWWVVGADQWGGASKGRLRMRRGLRWSGVW